MNINQDSPSTTLTGCGRPATLAHDGLGRPILIIKTLHFSDIPGTDGMDDAVQAKDFEGVERPFKFLATDELGDAYVFVCKDGSLPNNF